MNPINIPDDILLSAFRVARSALPAECCGWLTGPKDGNIVTGWHACSNQLNSSGAYMMSESDVMEMVDSFGTDNPARIIFHSHPYSSAFFSSIDVAHATSPLGGPTYPVQHLVIGLNEERINSAALFAWSDDAAAFVQIETYRQ